MEFETLFFWQLIGVFVLLAYFWFFVHSLLDLIKRPFRIPFDRVYWLLLIVLAFPVGAFIYFFMVSNRDQKRKFLPDFTRNKPK